MEVDGLRIPDLLDALLDSGRWPRHAGAVSEQGIHPLIPDDRNRRLRRICLHPPPFRTVARIVADDRDGFYSTLGALHELVPDASIPIADFGIGADSPILLDFRAGPSDPRVIYLEWSKQGDSTFWVELAPDFAGFVELLGLS